MKLREDAIEQTLYSLVAVLLALIIGYIAGKHSQVDVVKTQESNTTHTTIKTVRDKAGREKTVTIIDSKTEKKAEVQIKPGPKTNVSALVGNDFSKSLPKPLYGINVSREFLGPVTIGAFGLTNGVLGVSVGLNF